MSKNTNPIPHVERPNPFLAVDDIPDNFDLVPRSKPNVWVLPGIFLTLAVGTAYFLLR